jgi:hypothetical protein
MRRLNIRSPKFDYEADDPAGFRSGTMRLGPLLAASQLGLSVYELPQGQAIGPFSTVLQPAATVYPDSDKIAIWTGNSADDVIVRRASGVDYWDGETVRRPS